MLKLRRHKISQFLRDLIHGLPIVLDLARKHPFGSTAEELVIRLEDSPLAFVLYANHVSEDIGILVFFNVVVEVFVLFFLARQTFLYLVVVAQLRVEDKITLSEFEFHLSKVGIKFLASIFLINKVGI